MFEQTMVTGGETRPWTFLVSVSGQVLVAAVFLAIPLIYTETLGLRTPAPPPIIFRPVEAPPPVQRTTAPQVPSTSTNVFRRFADAVLRAPTKIPSMIANIVDEPGPNISEPRVQGAVPGGPGDGIPISLLNGTAPPPLIKPVEVVKPAPPARIAVGGQVLAAKLIHRVVPVYPPLARQARVSGVVRLLGVVAKDGTIQKLELVSGHPLLSGAALEAVRQWIYKPTLLNGQPVEVQAPIDVIFTLGQ